MAGLARDQKHHLSPGQCGKLIRLKKCHSIVAFPSFLEFQHKIKLSTGTQAQTAENMTNNQIQKMFIYESASI